MGCEYLDYILAVKVVDSFEDALNCTLPDTHPDTATRSSPMTITNARAFTERVDSAAVYVNASTRFTDGGEFGCGAEIRISTQKLHARGPMGCGS